jgi:cell division protein FtsQ
MSTPAATAAGRRRAGAGSSRSPARPKSSRKPPTKRSPRSRPTARSRGSSRFSLSSWRTRLILVAIVAGALAIAYFAWFRHSSFVAVENVTAALTDAAKGMSTLDLDASRLASAVSGFPTVASVTADASFPHGLTVHVTERTPVLAASDGDHQVAVAADGSLLPGVDVAGNHLPVLKVDQFPPSGRMGGEALDDAHAIAAAPKPLAPLIEGVSTTHDYGVVITLHGGIALRFGSPSKSTQKWAAAAAVLADPRVTSLGYVDVAVPARPAIGG